MPKNRSTDDNTVTRPAHYGGEANPHEPIKVIEHYGLGFCLGNTIKYILRAPFKGATLEDLKKARWYLDRKIQRMENRLCELRGYKLPGEPGYSRCNQPPDNYCGGCDSCLQMQCDYYAQERKDAEKPQAPSLFSESFDGS